jgi:hypothetical protein
MEVAKIMLMFFKKEAASPQGRGLLNLCRASPSIYEGEAGKELKKLKCTFPQY